METYHQAALFDLAVYDSEPPCSDNNLDYQGEKFIEKVKFDHLQLDLFTELLIIEIFSSEHFLKAA